MEEGKILQILEIAKNTGKVRIGANETTKVVERGIAKLVVTAEDVDPKEVIMHLPHLCKEKNIPYATVGTKKELGRAAGIDVPTAAVAVIQEGEAKKLIESMIKPVEKPKVEKKEEKPAEKKETPEEKPKAEKKDKPKAPKKEKPAEKETPKEEAPKKDEKPKEEPKKEEPEAEEKKEEKPEEK
ncbi:MAG: 50S ribosomal protein L7ae [Candidatus Aenigmarchaeota archaeon]|nr:50S ribosomal protein L7ae [Candidatus Aenigmarchaeota archaeon]